MVAATCMSKSTEEMFNNKLTMIANVDNILLTVVKVIHFSHMLIIIPHWNFSSRKFSYLCSKKTMLHQRGPGWGHSE